MKSRRSDIEIGHRTAEEYSRISGNGFRVPRNTVAWWRDGFAPSAFWLARLCYAGADVIYILTGRRST